MIDEIYDGWSADLAAGRVSLMVSASTAEVAALSASARRDRVVAGAVESDGLALHDGNQAGAGDLIVTRENQRALTQQIRLGALEVLGQELGRVNTVIRGHRVVLLRRTLVGLLKDHAVAASHHGATLNNGATPYTTSVDSTGISR